MTKTILHQIWRYPVKGFPGQELSSTSLKAGAGIPNDRRYAVTKDTTDTGNWMPSRNYFINARVDGMAKFKCDFDGTTISLQNINGETLSFETNNEESLQVANSRIKSFMQPVITEELSIPPKITDRGKGSVWDYIDTPISIINAESVRALDKKLGTNLDPSRFRGNLIISGLPAWEEFSWMGKRIQIGECILDVHRPIDRCPTPGVNPETGERDIEVTPGLRDHFGHIYCGMYANVVQGGEIKNGDEIAVIDDGQIRLEDTFVSNASNYALWPRMAEVTACEFLDKATKIIIKTTSPWLPPEAKAGQRLKLHLGLDGWTQEYITSTTENEYTIEVEDSSTDDPITAKLRRGLEIGKRIVISGPFGQV